MSQSNKKDICRELNYFSISVSTESSVLIIGGGNAAYIKAKSLISKGAKVTILAEEFKKEFRELKVLKLIKGKYYEKIIENYHLIIIAINNDIIRKKIIDDCTKYFKLYVDCSEYKNGLVVMQSQGQLKNINYAVNTTVAVPKLSKLLLKKIRALLSDYDDFVLVVSKLREEAKKTSDKEKQQIINFICSDDFKFFFDKKKEKLIMKIFFDDIF